MNWNCLKSYLKLINGTYAAEKVLQFHNKKEDFLIMGVAEITEEVFTNAKVVWLCFSLGQVLKERKLIETIQ